MPNLLLHGKIPGIPLIFLLVLLIPHVIIAEVGGSGQPVKRSVAFVENKGQIIDQNNNPHPSVLFLLNLPGMNVQLRKRGFSYDLFESANLHPETVSKEEVKVHRIDFELVNANPECMITTGDTLAEYSNYYTAGTPSGGVTGVRRFTSILYKNIYPQIHLEFLLDEKGGFKYNFVILPGGKLGDILFRINDPRIELLPNGDLRLCNSVADVEEKIPLSYLIQGNDKHPMTVRFVNVGKGLYGFVSDQSNPGYLTMVIDPTPRRIWGSYYGGTGSDLSNDIAMDAVGNLYFCGSTSSTNNIATAGSYQSTLKGSYDSFLVRFTSDGQRVWGTYYGGGLSENFEACACDPTGNIYLTGRTNSTTFIATPGAHQPGFGGGLYDNYLAKFNAAGQLLWGTYYGGSGIEGEMECIIDSLNVYICGFTSSSDNISTSGSHQIVNNGNTDAYLAKFDSNGVRVWGTFYGGGDSDHGYACAVSQDGMIYLAGKTLSETNISTSGSHQPLHAGGGDAFLVKFTSAGQRLWGTYYGGLNTDEAHGCSVDTNDFVYFGGYSTSAENISTPGCQQPNYAGFGDGFIAKFNSGGTRQWGTYCGGSMQEVVSKRDLFVDDSCYVYFNGNTTSPDGIVTADAYQTTISGNFDAFLVKYNDQGVRIWGTYYGGPALDNGIASVSDNCAHQYLLGNTGSLTEIATAGAHQPAYGGGTIDAFIVKLTDCLPPDTAEQISGPNQVCANSTVLYSVPVIPRANGYAWSLPSGFTVISGANTHSISVHVDESAVSGLISVYGTSCCEDGVPSVLSVSVNLRPLPAISGNDAVCQGDSAFFFTESNQLLYEWIVSPGGSILSGGMTSDTSVTVTWSVPGLKWVSVNYTNSEGCGAILPASKNIIVSVGSPVNVTISESSNNICSGASVTFTAVSVNPGSTPFYQWRVNSVNTGSNSPIFTYIPGNGDMVHCILTSSNTICTSNNPDTSNSINLIVLPLPMVTFAACFDTITTINAKPIRLKGGIPLGGNYSGLAVSNGVFYPNLAGVGTNVITYSFTNAALCSASSQSRIHLYTSSPFICGNTLNDIRDGKSYPTVKIGSQCWMATNLNFGLQTSDLIPQRDNCLNEKYCYQNLIANCELRGASYQWDELMRYDDTPGSQGLCPPAWHIPTEAEWNTLFANWTNNGFAGSPLKYSGYSGFSALLIGVNLQNRRWDYFDKATFFWSSNPQGYLKAWSHALNDYDPSVALYPSLRSNALSVRCIRD